jgi:NADH dehydrogenase
MTEAALRIEVGREPGRVWVMEEHPAPHVVVLGGGFGGLAVVRGLEGAGARITLVDRENHHLFQPLLYQVATAGLGAPDIAYPIRSIFARRPDVSVLMDEVRAVDLAARRVQLAGGSLAYDYLVIALGGVTSYFGKPEWEEFAPGLKTVVDAQLIRQRLLGLFEQAEREADPAVRRRLMTLVVVGGGPTGVELAGALAELTRHVLVNDFRRIDPTQTHIVLVDRGDRLLSMMPEPLSEAARRTLVEMGVEVRLQTGVSDLGDGWVQLGAERLEVGMVLWAAGVQANPVTRSLGVELDRAGRVKVAPDLSLPGHSEVFAIGDIATVVDRDGQPVPGIAPAAMQGGGHVARVIREAMHPTRAEGVPRPAFDYWDKGIMATIGRSAAVAKSGPVELTGFLAWVMWLVVHLLFLIGFRNKAVVLVQWAWNYVTYGRGARLMVRPARAPFARSAGA